jgi:hypothetical protein
MAKTAGLACGPRRFFMAFFMVPDTGFMVPDTGFLAGGPRVDVVIFALFL